MFSTIPKFLEQLREWLKQPALYFLPVLAVTSFGLFAPDAFLENLGIATWRTDGKFYLGSLFVISFAVVFCHYFIIFIGWVSNWNSFYRQLWVGHSRLKSLTPDEQNILRGYIESQSKTQLLDPFSGVVTGLTNAKIIYASADQGQMYNFPFNIREWAWIYLNKHPHLVGINVEGKKKIT